VTDLAGTQISNLLETLPGIAQVLRSPVADAFVGMIRAATGEAPFNFADADEILKYAVRRNLMAVEESERILAEARQAAAAQAAAARARTPREAPAKARPAAGKAPKAAKPAKSKAKPKAKPKAKARKVTRKPAKAAARKPAKPAPRKAARKPVVKKKAAAKK
jgi:hypothetical protein